MNEKHTCWTCICNFPSFSPRPCCGMWFYVYLFGLCALCMSTTADTLGYTHAYARACTTHAHSAWPSASNKPHFKGNSGAEKQDMKMCLKPPSQMKSEVENVLATQQNQMPWTWRPHSVFMLPFITEAHAGSISSTVVDAIYVFYWCQKKKLLLVT